MEYLLLLKSISKEVIVLLLEYKFSVLNPQMKNTYQHLVSWRSGLTCSNMKANSTLSLGTPSVSRKQYSLK